LRVRRLQRRGFVDVNVGKVFTVLVDKILIPLWTPHFGLIRTSHEIEQLTFEATVSDTSVVSAVVNGTSLYITNAMTVSGTSSATVTVTASDPDASVSDTFTATFVFRSETHVCFSDEILTGDTHNKWYSEISLTFSDGTTLKKDGDYSLSDTAVIFTQVEKNHAQKRW
jgi:hypothetical protein